MVLKRNSEPETYLDDFQMKELSRPVFAIESGYI